MTDQRDPKIRAAIVELGSASPNAPSFDDIVATADSYGTLTSAPRRIPNWVAAVGAAAAAVVVIGGATWLLDQSGDEVVEEPIPTSTIATTTTQAVNEEATFPQQRGFTGTVTTFGYEDGLPGARAGTVAVTADGSVWASIIGPGIKDCRWSMARFDGTTWSILEITEGESTLPTATSDCSDTPFVGATGDGTLWFVGPEVATDPEAWVHSPLRTGLWSWKDGEWTDHGAPSTLAPAGLGAIDLAGHPGFAPIGTAWFGTDDVVWMPVVAEDSLRIMEYDARVSALARYQNGAWELFAIDRTVAPPDIQCASGMVDESGGLRLTTPAGDQAVFDGEFWTTVRGTVSEYDWGCWWRTPAPALVAGPDGAIWQTTGPGLVRWYEGDRDVLDPASGDWIGMTTVHGFSGGAPTSVTPDGTVWILGHGRLAAFDPEGRVWSLVPRDIGIPHIGGLASMTVDHEGAIWIADPGGYDGSGVLQRFVPEHVTE